jgi:hypothetical protein
MLCTEETTVERRKQRKLNMFLLLKSPCKESREAESENGHVSVSLTLSVSLSDPEKGRKRESACQQRRMKCEV